MSIRMKVIIIILAVHYFLAIGVLFLVLKDNLRAGIKPNAAKLVSWNLIVLFLFIIGPILYLIYRLIAKPQKKVSPPVVRTDTEKSHIEDTTDKIDRTEPNLTEPNVNVKESKSIDNQNNIEKIEQVENVEQTEQIKREKSEDK